MIYTDLPIYELYLFHLTQLFYNLHQISLGLTIHYFSPIFWYKNNMVRAIPVRMLYTLIIHLDTSYAFDMACETNIIIA